MNMSFSTRGFEAARRTLQSGARNVRFAAMQAVNDTGREVQQFTVNKLLPEKFTLRSRGSAWQKPGNKLGFNLKFASKQTLTATLGSQANWLELQEKGGTKTAKGHRVAIAAQVRDTPTSIIPSRRKPRRLLERKQAFIIATRKGDVVFERTGPRELKPLYALKPSARVPARLQFISHASALADATFSQRFTMRFASAVASSR